MGSALSTVDLQPDLSESVRSIQRHITRCSADNTKIPRPTSLPGPTSLPVAQKQSSKLLQLPSELRNRIYVLGLIPAHGVRILIPNCRFAVEVNDDARTILRVCRQTNREARGLYYSCNTFHIPGEELGPWLLRIGKLNRESLADVRITHLYAHDHAICMMVCLQMIKEGLAYGGLDLGA